MSKEKKEKKVVTKGKKVAIILASISVVVAGIAGTIFALQHKAPKDTNNTPSNPPIEEVEEYNTENRAINSLVCEHTEYENFNYQYTTYTYLNGQPVVQLNGTTNKNGQVVYSTLSYSVSNDVYEMFVGSELKIQKDSNGKFSFLNDQDNITEEEIILKQCILESIIEKEPDQVKEMTYSENLDNMVNYFRKKNGIVMCNNIRLVKETATALEYDLDLYVDVSTKASEHIFDIKTINLKQVKNNMLTVNDTYRVNPDKAYKLSFGPNSEGNNLTSEEYLDVYMDYKGNMGDVYNSIINNEYIDIYLSSNYRNLYNSQELER